MNPNGIPSLNLEGKLQIVAGLGAVHRVGNGDEMQQQGRQGVRRQFDDRNAPVGETLLIPEILVGRDQHVEAIALRNFKQGTVLEFSPAALEGRGRFTSRKCLPDPARHAVVEQHPLHAAAGSPARRRGSCGGRIPAPPQLVRA